MAHEATLKAIMLKMECYKTKLGLSKEIAKQRQSIHSGQKIELFDSSIWADHQIVRSKIITAFPMSYNAKTGYCYTVIQKGQQLFGIQIQLAH